MASKHPGKKKAGRGGGGGGEGEGEGDALSRTSKATVFVRGLPLSIDDAALESLFSEAGPVKKCFVIRDKASRKSRGYGFVLYALQQDAASAVKLFNGRDEQGSRLRVAFALKKNRPFLEKEPGEVVGAAKRGAQKKQKKPARDANVAAKAAAGKRGGRKGRLIVRNLAFGVTEKKLAKVFAKYGKVVETHIPRHKDSGKSRGFAFVEYAQVAHAEKALRSVSTFISLCAFSIN